MPKLARALTLLLIAVALSAPLSACGKKGSLVKPEDGEYPRTYPTR